MPALEGMHSPGSETAHLLPPAGMKSYKDEVYRFHRVIPYYPPDACVRPNEADLACPPEKPNTKNNVAVMPAGISTRPVSDRFAFHKAREGSSTRPCQPQIGQSRLAAVTQQPCPCFNRVGCSPGQPVELSTTKNLNTLTQRENMPNKGINFRQQVTDVQHGKNATDSCYNYTPCWPLPGQRGVSMATSNQVKANAPQPQFGQFGQNVGNDVEGHVNPTPWTAQQGPLPYHPQFTPGAQLQLHYGAVPSGPPRYICQPVYDVKYLNDCPQQDGPPADSYTFL